MVLDFTEQSFTETACNFLGGFLTSNGLLDSIMQNYLKIKGKILTEGRKQAGLLEVTLVAHGVRVQW